MFKELGIPGLKPERLEVVSAIFKGDVFAEWLRKIIQHACILLFKLFLRERAGITSS